MQSTAICQDCGETSAEAHLKPSAPKRVWVSGRFDDFGNWYPGYFKPS